MRLHVLTALGRYRVLDAAKHVSPEDLVSSKAGVNGIHALHAVAAVAYEAVLIANEEKLRRVLAGAHGLDAGYEFGHVDGLAFHEDEE